MKLQLPDLKSYKMPTIQIPTLTNLSEKFKSIQETTTTKIQNIRQELSLLPPRERNILYGTTALGVVASGLSIYALIQKTTVQPVVLTGQPIVLGEVLNITENQTSDPLDLADSTEIDLTIPVLVGIVGAIVVLTAGYFACCGSKTQSINGSGNRDGELGQYRPQQKRDETYDSNKNFAPLPSSPPALDEIDEPNDDKSFYRTLTRKIRTEKLNYADVRRAVQIRLLKNMLLVCKQELEYNPGPNYSSTMERLCKREYDTCLEVSQEQFTKMEEEIIQLKREIFEMNFEFTKEIYIKSVDTTMEVLFPQAGNTNMLGSPSATPYSQAVTNSFGDSESRRVENFYNPEAQLPSQSRLNLTYDRRGYLDN